MKHDGVQCRESIAYSWRNGNPETDVDSDGKPVKRNYIVLVRIKDCPIVEKDGGRYYQPKDVPQAMPLAYGGTNYGYGKSKVVNGSHRWVGGEFMSSYIKTPYYFVKDGRVYAGACYRANRKVAGV